MCSAFSEKDLAKFQKEYGLPAQLVRNISAGGEGLGQAEANLDIQCMWSGHLGCGGTWLEKVVMVGGWVS